MWHLVCCIRFWFYDKCIFFFIEKKTLRFHSNLLLWYWNEFSMTGALDDGIWQISKEETSLSCWTCFSILDIDLETNYQRYQQRCRSVLDVESGLLYWFFTHVVIWFTFLVCIKNCCSNGFSSVHFFLIKNEPKNQVCVRKLLRTTHFRSFMR